MRQYIRQVNDFPWRFTVQGCRLAVVTLLYGLLSLHPPVPNNPSSKSTALYLVEISALICIPVFPCCLPLKRAQCRSKARSDNRRFSPREYEQSFLTRGKKAEFPRAA